MAPILDNTEEIWKINNTKYFFSSMLIFLLKLEKYILHITLFCFVFTLNADIH